MKVLGRVLESLSPRIVKVVAPEPIPLGEYLTLTYQVSGREAKAIAIVANAQSRHAVLPSPIRYMEPEEGREVKPLVLSEMQLYVMAEKIGNGKLMAPRYPIPPETPVRRSTKEELEELYGQKKEKKEGHVKLGTLAIGEESSIEIWVDANKLTKHLFIAGATGSGKSNTVAILIDRLASKKVPVVVFDVHGEYSMDLKEGGKLEVIEAVINPMHFVGRERVLAGIIIPEAKAMRQRRLLVKAIRKLHEELKEREKNTPLKEALLELAGEKQAKEDADDAELYAELYAKALIKMVRTIGMNDRSYGSKIVGPTEDKVEEFFEVAPVSLTAPHVLADRARGTVLVVNAFGLSDEEKRWMLKFIVDKLLLQLKKEKGSNSCVLVVEEAPLFLGDKLHHPVKDSLQRFAREGRKFGGSLVVVSQRPRSLDVNVVSQLQNFIFLKVVQEEDVRTIMNIADSLEESLAAMIKSFEEGRALVLGEFLGKFPAVVKIDQHKGKRLGATPDLIKPELEVQKERRGFEA
ncbi:MAG: ATP-binding protein [Acidilobaceae archaeon]|nr:ATP-binding protein [Acidilobaceae archaeon]MDW7974729.1 ATP-binding protein [Sulfolobales archaeon]